MPLCPPQILHGLAWERTHPSSLGGGSPTAMADMSTSIWSVNVASKEYHKRRASSYKDWLYWDVTLCVLVKKEHIASIFSA